jgi:uncharacterized Tic20 family protein
MKSRLSSAIRAWGVICHLSALTYLAPLFYLFITLGYSGFFRNPIEAGFPFNLVIWSISSIIVLWFTPHYAIWISQRKIHPFIDRQGREIKRFQLWTAKRILLPWLIFTFGIYPLVVFWLIHLVRSVYNPLTNSGSAILQIGLILTVGSMILLSFAAIGFVSIIMMFYHLFQIVVAADKASQGKLYIYPVEESN